MAIVRMNRRQFVSSAAALGGAALILPRGMAMLDYRSDNRRQKPLTPTSPLSASGAFDIGSRAQLFIDQQCIRTSRGVYFALHPARKHPLNPLLRATQPWEGWRVMLSGTVLFDPDERLFKMWYLGERTPYFPNYAAFYATSRDGVVWEKPLVGTVKCANLLRHNAVLNASMIANVIKDNADPDPSRRYKMIARNYRVGTGDGPLGPKALVSPDGLNWTRINAESLFHTDDDVTAYYDDARRLYVAMAKVFVPVRGTVRRCFSLTTSADLLKWSPPRLIFTPDLRDDAGVLARIEEARAMLDMPDDATLMRTEFYSVGTYQAESSIVAFLSVFSINNNNRFGNSQEGPNEIQLATSRDLTNWERPFRIPVVQRGGLGEWDSGFFTTASHAFRYGDEIRLYYGCGNYTHGTPALYHDTRGERGTRYTCSLGLATWPLDRFVSVNGGSEGGILTTVPVQFSGRRLELNLKANQGEVTVALLDASGKTIPGYGISDPVISDSLRATVSWQGKSELGAMAGKPVSLRFALRNAELYSFAFRG